MKLRMKCSRCVSNFNLPLSMVRAGGQASCPNCQRVIYFDTESPDRFIRKALTDARLARKAAAEAALAAPSAPRQLLSRSE